MKFFLWVGVLLAGFVLVIIATPIATLYLIKGWICWNYLVAGPVTASVVVTYSYLAAPKNDKALFSFMGFLIGAVLVCFIPDITDYPDCHERAYDERYPATFIPLIVTYLAGFITLLVVLFWERKNIIHKFTKRF